MRKIVMKKRKPKLVMTKIWIPLKKKAARKKLKKKKIVTMIKVEISNLMQTFYCRVF